MIFTENKDADQLHSNFITDQHLCCLIYRLVTILCFINYPHMLNNISLTIKYWQQGIICCDNYFTMV